MKKMTEENLRAAFAGESQASVKYQLFAEVAEKAGLTKTATQAGKSSGRVVEINKSFPSVLNCFKNQI